MGAAPVIRGPSPGQNNRAMRLPNGVLGIAVAGVLIVGLAADLVLPESGVSAALARVLGASSIGLAVWTLAKIAR